MPIPRSLIFAFLIVAFLGFVDASYLTATHYSNIALPCYIVQGCETVTTSVYSKIFGIPVSLLGVLYYLSVLVIVMIYVDKRNKTILKILHGLTSAGFIMTLWFLYAQAIIIQEYCLYCLFSALTSTLLFVLGALAYHKKWPELNSTTDLT
jgi:uncharacterized membrane protein